MDWDKDLVLQIYSETLKILNKFEDLNSYGLTKDVFSKGCTVFAFDLSPTCTDLN